MIKLNAPASGAVRASACCPATKLIVWTTLAIAACSGTVQSASAKDDRPYNFVVIMADDLGAKELGCYGHQTHRTPNLDRLATEGTQFRTCYATPICSSTRIMIMTGRYGFRTGWFNFLERTYSPRRDSPQYDIGQSEVTFADVLKTKGYATAIAGKWQLPGTAERRIYDCGFDEYCMWMWLHDLPDGRKHTGAFEGKSTVKTSRFWHPAVMLNAKYRPTTAEEYGPDIYTDFVNDFIKRNAARPFCVYYPMALTHTPWDPTPDLEHPGQKTKKGLKTNVEYMDHLIGRITKTIDELGLAERTVIIFTGDNGTGGDGKGTTTELGARVPLIVRCPGTVSQGIISDELSDLTDILPTLAEFAGADLPAGREIDGVSLVSTLRGKPGPTREWAFSYLANKRVLRDRQWLLENNSADDFGQFYRCGSRNGDDYVEVTDSKEPAVLAAKKRFEKILSRLPGPEGYPGLVQPKPRKQRRK